MMGVLRRRERMRDYLALWKRLRAIIFHVLLAIGLLKSAQLASAGFLAHD